MANIEISLTAKQSEFDKAVDVTENTFFGGAKGGGKSHGLREIMLKRRIQYANSTGVIFRKTYPELYNNHINPLLSKFPMLRAYYNNQNKEIKFPNGSLLAFRHCQYERDLSLHQGQEYHDLGIEEAGEWDESWFWTLKGSNRSSYPRIPVRCLLTGNPGGIGHKWLKRLFIDRAFRSMENPNDFAFILARVYDNPAIMANDPSYINRLKSNKNEMLVKAYLEGSWDIQAGQFFDMISRETHTVPDFDIPDHWERMGAFDTGYNHPAAFLWLAMDTDGNVYVYREYLKSKKRTEEIVAEVMSYPDSKKLKSIPAGLDCWTKHSGDPSVEEKFSQYSNHDLVLSKASIERVAGAQHLRDYFILRPTPSGKFMPRLRIFRTCVKTLDTIIRMTHDENRPEDVLKVDADADNPDSGDDLYDCLRYALMDRPRLSVEPPKKMFRKFFKDDDENVVPSWTTV
jgi:phage terminase large subunit